MRRISIDPSDEHRVLLTDVLPYETPVFFSNEGFYRFCREHLSTAPPIVRRLLTGFPVDTDKQELSALNTIPYGYQIRKGTLDTRTLSLFHPAVQLQIVSLYSRFEHMMLHLCKRSRFSLRYPASVASAVYGKEDQEGDDEPLRYGATFFKYEKYDLLYKFFDSYEFLRLEKRFRHLRKFDISKCFDHIYTHTLSWAVRSKEFAKKHIGHRSFDSDFDAIMQAANHKETAGILIGPEVSRIFAEVILQRVDAAVEQRLAPTRKHGLDYDVRRYVDDYYVFSSTADIGEEVMRAYHQELKQYRLDFNDAKSTSMVVPFMTSISCAKVVLSDLLSEFFDSLAMELPVGDGSSETVFNLRNLWDPGRKANRLVQRIKATVVSFDVEFASISGFIFSVVERRLKRILDHLPTDYSNDVKVGDVLFAVLDASFFIYAMDVRVSTTYKIGRIAIQACKTVENLSPEVEELIKKKIYDESRHILEAETRGHPELHVEIVNLLAVIRVLGEEYRVATETVSRMIEGMERDYTDGQQKGIDYFLVTSLLFHMGNDLYYENEKGKLLKRVIQDFKTTENASNRTDFTCLFLDLLRCPFVEPSFKEELARRFTIWEKSGSRFLTLTERDNVLSVVKEHQWFTDWGARDSIEVLLRRKRHRTPY